MKYIDEYRDGELARQIAQRIRTVAQPEREYRFMEFCGGHTHAISRYGVSDLLPTNVRLIHGPGCPVCVLPIGRIDLAIRLAMERQVILCSYGDTMRVPASDGLSLLRAKARGADIRMIYSPQDALKIAEANPEREVVFFAVGFETTTPPTALVIREAARRAVDNFSVLCCHVLTPPAIAHILDAPAEQAVALDGFIGPAHVSVVIGAGAYGEFARRYRKPVVIAGFEPLDVLQSILMLVQQVNEGRAEVQNEFIRAVSDEGSRPMQALMEEVFELRECFEWRGLGEMPASARRIRPASPGTTPKRASPCTTSPYRTTRPATAGRSCAGRNSLSTADCSARSAPRRTLSAPAWFPTRVPAPRTTPTGATRTSR